MKKTLRKLNSLLAVFIIASMVSFAYGQITALPTIDGVDTGTEWDAATEWPLEAVINTDSVTDAADLSGTVKVMWSADSLYILCKQMDDELYVGAGNAYEYDNIAIYIDAYNKATGAYVDSTQVYFEKNWYDGPQMGGRTGTNWAAPPGNWAADTNLVDDGMYTIEIAYAWASVDKTPAAGDVLGFDVKMNDNEGPVESEHRDQIAWRDVTDGGWNNPSLWGEITLVADGSATGMTDFDVILDGDASDRAWAPSAATALTSIISTVGVENAADQSGDFKLKWDEDYLYVLSTVKDDSLYFGTSDAYRYDNICVYVDAYNKKSDAFLDSTQVYYEKNWWNGPQMGGRVGTDWKAPMGDWAADTALADDGMYVIEIAYPWASADKTPAVGDIVGFDVKLSDNDGDVGDLVEPRAQITYMDITDGGWNDPSLWGEVELLEGGFVAALSMRPAKPAGLAAEVADSVVTITWTDNEAMTYNVYVDGVLEGEAVEDATYVVTISREADDAVYTISLRAADADGVLSNAVETEVTILGTTGIDHHVIGNVSVYPNPASEVLNIQSDEEITSVNIMSMSGQIVETMSVNAFNTMIDLSNVKSGIYIVNVKLNNYSQNYRIIVR